jgi:hypothetical protein
VNSLDYPDAFRCLSCETPLKANGDCPNGCYDEPSPETPGEFGGEA